MKYFLLNIFMAFCLFSFAQNPNKKTLGHEELVSWKRIQNQQISNDGNWIVYNLKPEEGNQTLKVWNSENNQTKTFNRSKDGKFSSDSRFLVFKIKADWDSLRMMKLDKIEKEELPKDTLGIYNLETGELEKIANIKSFKMPEKWAGWLVFHREVEKIKKDTATQVIDSTKMESPDSLVQKEKKKKGKKPKKESKKSGTKLVIRNLSTGAEEIIPFVKDYTLSKEGNRVLARSTGKDSTFLEGIYLFDTQSNILKPIIEQKGDYKNLTFDEKGQQVTFHLNLDTTKMRIPPFALAYWKEGMEAAKIVADTLSKILPEDWRVSENAKLSFSKNGQKLYFGIALNPFLPDTTLLDSEVAKVEVWHWEDPVLHTQQNNRLEKEKKRTYAAVWHISDNKIVQLGAKDLPEVRLGDEGNSNIALGYDEAPYFKSSSWESWPHRRDVYIIDTKNWNRTLIGKGIKGSTSLSPKAKFTYWYSPLDSAWFSYNISNQKTIQITNNQKVKFYREIHDIPAPPSSNGNAGWTINDEFILIYDRYDIWQIDPNGIKEERKLTNGREQKLRYRYIRLDREQRNIDLSKEILLHVFDEKTKGSGYATLNPETGAISQMLFDGNYSFTSRPQKARDANQLIFTKQNFQVFPNLHHANLNFENPKQVSDANPQQKDYSWGSVELYKWTDLNGNELTGMLVKPENFDASKKYPMLVNFYEKSSNGLHRHRTPLPGRSTINYPFYASKGYVIFNPDVPYRTGYPGESALNAVLPSITSLIDDGFVDKERIGVQGHSWGGYQVSYLINHTDIFKCAESGAPVVNMFSAYGGIRWGSGMSRMFQYEQTQSRIGGTIWEYPLRYIENSPIFDLDKCDTPVLIMHNDKDGAVPWYQGIEYFVGLRRLGKPAWMLNYNGEPHWPVKLANRKDFNIRMQQYFDYYLMDAPMPNWMKRGVPAMEKGILQGLETKE